MPERRIELIVIHCTATPNGHPVTLKEVDSWHKARGFRKVGYHHLIDVDGSVDVGRDEEEIGAHAAPYNSHSIGVCLVGGVGGPDRLNPGLYTPAQWESLKIAIEDLLGRYPGARVVGHRDLSPDKDGDGEVEPHEWVKLCPSFDVAKWIAGGMETPSENTFHRVLQNA